jgi:hypothetical protein
MTQAKAKIMIHGVDEEILLKTADILPCLCIDQPDCAVAAQYQYWLIGNNQYCSFVIMNRSSDWFI